MSTDSKLYDLLPAIYRIRDEEHGEALKYFLSVIAEQVAALEDNMEQLYDDQFIETCAEWVAPYIGDLLGVRGLHRVTAKTLSHRAYVANTIAYRRRKGTAAILEQLARDVTGWNTRVVEFFEHLGWTQYMNHVRTDPPRGGTLDVRDAGACERITYARGAFDSAAHTVDVRRISIGSGRYNIQNVGIFLWRLNAYPLTRVPARKLKPADPADGRYVFSSLGQDIQLFNFAEPEGDITHLAERVNVPMPITRGLLRENKETYYGRNKSLLIEVNGQEVAAANVVSCNLSDTTGGDWAGKPPAGMVAIDPVRGRMAFEAPPAAQPFVTFYYGFSAETSGGEYERRTSFEPGLQPVHAVSAPASLSAELNTMGGGGVLEIVDGGIYAETPAIHVNAQKRLELRAANEYRPVLVLNGDLHITGGEDSEVTINGLLITGGALRVAASGGNKLRRLKLRHCTLAPEKDAGGPKPGLIVDLPGVDVEIHHCILGALRVAEKANVEIRNSIVDATAPTSSAYAAADGSAAGAALRLVNSTIIGKVHTVELDALNSIFLSRLANGDSWPAPVRCTKRQAGAVCFCYAPVGSETPRRRRCQPDLNPGTEPFFTSMRYGDPGYMQLSIGCPIEIRSGADDESEMGAFHDLYQSQRETNLRVRLDEYLRFGLEAAIIYVT